MAASSARPEFYGILLFILAGQGNLVDTQISAESLNVTAYAVKTSSGGLNLVVVNKVLTQNLQPTAQLPQTASSATLLNRTQFTGGASGPDLSATSGVTLQGASVNPDGSFAPSAAYTLNPSRSQLRCCVPVLKRSSDSDYLGPQPHSTCDSRPLLHQQGLQRNRRGHSFPPPWIFGRSAIVMVHAGIKAPSGFVRS
jgi:hypothetical protein